MNFSTSFWIIFVLLQEFSFWNQLSYFHHLFYLPVLSWLDGHVSLDILELLDSCESLDFFELTLPLSDALLLLLNKHCDDLALWAASLSQQCTSLLKEHTCVSISSNQSSSLPLSSSLNNWFYSWCASNNILKRSLNCFISSSRAVMFLLENNAFNGAVLSYQSAIDLPSPLLESLLYAKPFSVRFLDLVPLTSLRCGMTASLALCSTHCEYELSPDMLDVSLILVQFPCCRSSLTIIDWHRVIPFGFLLSVSGSWKSVSNFSPSYILLTMLTNSPALYTTCMLLRNRDLSDVTPYRSFDESFSYHKQLLRNYKNII